MNQEKVYDIEKIISSGYGKTAKSLAEEIVAYLTPKDEDYFSFFIKETYTIPDINFGHNGRLLTIAHYSSSKNDIKVTDMDFSSVRYTWDPIPSINILKDVAKNIVLKINKIKDSANKNEIQEHGFIYAVHESNCCMFGYIVWR